MINLVLNDKQLFSTNCDLSALEDEKGSIYFRVNVHKYDSSNVVGYITFEGAVVDASDFVSRGNHQLFSSFSKCGKYALTRECADEKNLLSEVANYSYWNRGNTPDGYICKYGGNKNSFVAILATKKIHGDVFLHKNGNLIEGYYQRPE